MRKRLSCLAPPYGKSPLHVAANLPRPNARQESDSQRFNDLATPKLFQSSSVNAVDAVLDAGQTVRHSQRRVGVVSDMNPSPPSIFNTYRNPPNLPNCRQFL
jgi:hypothetical protein